MSDTQNPSPAPKQASSSKEESRQDKRALRWKTIKFVSVFVITVFVLLMGYEKVKITKFNDWYLFQVARTTAWLLGRVGHSCSLENSGGLAGREAEIRHTIGNSSSTPDEPLSPWEIWQYKAAKYRSDIAEARKQLESVLGNTDLAEPARTQQLNDAKMRLLQLENRDIGPLVNFLLEPGMEERIEETRKKLEAALADTSVPEKERTDKISALQTEIGNLEKAKSERDKNANPGAPLRDRKWFNFVVIPDCGAIPPMAIYVAAILAFPALWSRRLLGILIGLPFLYLVNAFRLAFLAVIGAIDRGGPVFRFTHEYIWQGIYIVFVVAVWMAWIEFLVRRRT